MNDIRNILVDLNDCVIGPPSKEFYEGLWKLAQIASVTKQEGAPFIMGACTGREMQYTRGVLHIAGSPRGWSICESGLGLLNVEDEIWIPHPGTDKARPLFENEVARAVVSIMAQHPGELRLYVGNMLNIAIEITGQAKITIETLFTEAKEALKEYLEKRLIKIHHSADAVDITAFDKGDGVIQVEEKTGIPRTETLGIGDSDGDRPFLKTTAFVGCPANAGEDCKQLVLSMGTHGYVSPESYVNGIADIIRHFTGVKVS